ncbi:MAG: hypothetical protein ACYTFA_03535 [Planctomycetota bacterium]
MKRCRGITYLADSLISALSESRWGRVLLLAIVLTIVSLLIEDINPISIFIFWLIC